MKPFRQRLADGVMVGDGGWGTLLADRGLPPGAAPERWTLERPEVLSEIAEAYVGAGAELITTNTFGGSPMRLRQHRLAGRCAEINRRGVELAREAARGRAYVSASMGPTGHLLQPLGDADPAEVAGGFAEQARVFADAGADVVCIETMTDLEEALAAVRAVRSVSDMPVIATMTFELTPRGPFTVMGVGVEKAAAQLAAAGADVVGANCGAGVEEMLLVARAFLACATVPVIVQPNAGLPQTVGGRLVYPESPASFAAAAAEMARLGVRIVGGCCGTTPEHIAAVHAAVA